MARLKRLLKEFLLNGYLGLLNLLLYPILLLLLPSRIPERVLKGHGDLIHLLSKQQRRKVTNLLKERLPKGRSDAEVASITRDNFRILTSFFFYTLFMITFRERKWLSRFVTYEGLHHLDGSLKDGQGVIMPTFHFNHPVATPGFLLMKDYRVTGYAVHPWDLKVPLVAKVNTWLGYRGGGWKGDLEMAYWKRGGRAPGSGPPATGGGARSTCAD